MRFIPQQAISRRFCSCATKPYPKLPGRFKAGFTLIELLVVVAIIAVLAALAMPVYQKVKVHGYQTACLSNMRQVGVAFHLYAGEHENVLPGRVATDADRWPRLLMPYLQTTQVYAAPGIENFEKDGTDPLSNGANGTSFIMNGYNDIGAFTDPSVEIRTIAIPHPSETILLGMPKPRDGNFYMDMLEGGGNHIDVLDLKAYERGSVYIFVDGAGRFIKESNYRPELWLVDKSFPVPTGS